MNKYKTLLTIGVLFLVVAGGLYLLSRPQASPQSKVNGISESEQHFDFGQVSMANGKVSHEYEIKNSFLEEMTITRLYTSCMCTEASLQTASQEFGPFGMPGHGMVPSIKATLAPGESATVLAIFDPAAHGPAGLGRIERQIILETADDKQIELHFSAEVMP